MVPLCARASEPWDSESPWSDPPLDFYSIEFPTRYAQRSKAGTGILFIKVPSVNDKQNVLASPAVRAWLGEKIQTVRSDFSNDPDAPPANSLRPAAAIAVVNEENEVLLVQRRDSGKWTMPGGTHEMGDGLASAAVREVKEETGMVV